jgi:hypothetical protein
LETGTAARVQQSFAQPAPGCVRILLTQEAVRNWLDSIAGRILRIVSHSYRVRPVLRVDPLDQLLRLSPVTCPEGRGLLLGQIAVG